MRSTGWAQSRRLDRGLTAARATIRAKATLQRTCSKHRCASLKLALAPYTAVAMSSRGTHARHFLVPCSCEGARGGGSRSQR